MHFFRTYSRCLKAMLIASSVVACVCRPSAVSYAQPNANTKPAYAGFWLPVDESARDAESVQLLEGSASGRIASIAFSPDGNSLVVGTDDRAVIVWDTRTGKERLCFSLPQEAGIAKTAVCGYSADGRFMVLAGDLSPSVLVVDGSTGKVVQQSTCQGSVVAGKVSPNGELFAISDSNYTVTLFSFKSLAAKKVLGTHRRAVEVLQFSPDSSTLAVSYGRDWPDKATAYDCKTGKVMWESTESQSPLSAIGFALDGKAMLVMEKAGRTLRILNAANGAPLTVGSDKVSTLSVAHAEVEDIATAAGGFLATLHSRSDHKITLVDLRTPQVLAEDSGLLPSLLKRGDGAVAIARRSGVVVAAGGIPDASIEAYTPDCRTQIVAAILPERGTHDLVVTADGSKAAVALEDKVILVRLGAEERRQAERTKVLVAQAEEARKAEERIAAEKAQAAAKELARQQLAAAQEAKETAKRERNAIPAWDGVENLNVLLEPFDGDLRAYVEFGTPENAEKGQGDRFDRIEAKKAAAEHRNALESKRFAWTAGSYRCRDGDEEADGDDEMNGDLVRQTLMIYLPFRIADTEKRLSTKVKVGNGRNAVFALMKDGSLRQLFDQRVIDEAEADNVALYIGDAETSFVQVVVEGKLEDIKRLVREPENHVVQFRLSKLAVRKPKAWGYYLKSAMNKAEGHYPWVQASGLAQKAAGVDQEGVTLDFIPQRDVPELVMAQVDAIEVARVDSQKREVLLSVPAEKPIGLELPPTATHRDKTNPPTQKSLVASLLGHWVDEDGSTHRYFSADTVIMVDENRVRPQSYRVVKSDEQAGTMTISCEGRNDRYSLPGARPVFYDLAFSKDRKAVTTRTYLRETDDPLEGKWTYVDAAREP